MWKLHRKLNFPNIFWLAAIYTWAPAFKHFNLHGFEMQHEKSNKTHISYRFSKDEFGDIYIKTFGAILENLTPKNHIFKFNSPSKYFYILSNNRD